MNILITGANGFAGQHLTLYLSGKAYTVIAAGKAACRIPSQNNFQYAEIDFTDAAAVASFIQEVKPDVVIHTIAMSKPDDCEKNHEACLALNVGTAENILSALKLYSPASHFIFLSTDFIFGENGPHAEDDEPAPLNFYGESKLIAEQVIKNSGITYTIVRPVFIYGESWQGLRSTFLHWVKNNLEQNKPIKVVSDQLRTPTFVLDLCKGIEQIILQNKQGSYHLAGKDFISPYQMAVTVAELLELNTALIEEVSSETFPEPVKRAKRSGLQIDKARRELKYEPVSFEEGVQLTFNIPVNVNTA